MNTSRFLFHIITITTEGVERALALGGYSSGSPKLNSVEEFDPDTSTWKPAQENLLVSRDWFGAVALPRNLICPAWAGRITRIEQDINLISTHLISSYQDFCLFVNKAEFIATTIKFHLILLPLAVEGLFWSVSQVTTGHLWDLCNLQRQSPSVWRMIYHCGTVKERRSKYISHYLDEEQCRHSYGLIGWHFDQRL